MSKGQGPDEDASKLKDRRRQILARLADSKKTNESEKAIQKLNSELRAVNEALGPQERRARQKSWKDPKTPKEKRRERQRKLEQLYKRRRLPHVPKMRDVVFPSGRKVHLARVSETSGRIGFTLCGERIPENAYSHFMTDNTPSSFSSCQRCDNALERIYEQ